MSGRQGAGLRRPKFARPPIEAHASAEGREEIMLGLIAKLKIQEGRIDEALELFKGLVEDVKTEAGTLSYTVNKDTADPNLIVVVERYRDAAALTAHSSTPHFAAFAKPIAGLLDGQMEMSIREEVASIRGT